MTVTRQARVCQQACPLRLAPGVVNRLTENILGESLFVRLLGDGFVSSVTCGTAERGHCTGWVVRTLDRSRVGISS